MERFFYFKYKGFFKGRVAIVNNLGCEDKDFENFISGKIAIIKRYYFYFL
jgi:hypothetical protein